MTSPDQRSPGTIAQVRSTVAAYGIRLVLGAIMGVVISRALEPAGRGSYSVIVIIASVATILGHLSIGQANVSFWATDRAAIPANNLMLGPPLGAAAALLVGAFVMTIGSDLVPVASPTLMWLALATVPLAVVILHLTTITLLLGRLDVVNRSLTISAFVQCVVLVALGWAGALSTQAVVWVWAITSLLPLAVLWPTIRPAVQKPDMHLARRMLIAGAQYHVGVIGLFLLLRIDVLILNSMAAPAAVGLYSLAVSVGEMAYAGTDALSQAMLRRQAEAHLDDAGGLTIRTTRVALLVATASVGAVCVAAPVAVPLLYGAAFAPSVPVLWALAPGLVLYAATRAISPYLLRMGRPWIMSGISLLALAFNVSLNLVLIPRWGTVGCALATTCGYGLFAICLVIWFSRSARVSPTALLPRPSDVSATWAAAVQPFSRRLAAGGKSR